VEPISEMVDDVASSLSSYQCKIFDDDCVYSLNLDLTNAAEHRRIDLVVDYNILVFSSVLNNDSSTIQFEGVSELLSILREFNCTIKTSSRMVYDVKQCSKFLRNHSSESGVVILFRKINCTIAFTMDCKNLRGFEEIILNGKGECLHRAGTSMKTCLDFVQQNDKSLISNFCLLWGRHQELKFDETLNKTYRNYFI
jgi:hypothetical protein